MNILYLSSTGGGLDTSVRVLAPALAAAGHHVSLLYMHLPGEPQPDSGKTEDGLYETYHATIGAWHYYARLATFGLTSFPLLFRSVEYTLAVSKAVSIIHTRRVIDLIETPEVFITPELAKHLPYIIRLHGAAWACRRLMSERSPLSDRVESRLEGFTLRRANGISSPSRMLANYIDANCDLAERFPIEIVPYPVDTVLLNPGRGRGGPPVVLFVGRVEKRKGADVLMRAIPQVLDKRPECKFVFAGAVADDMRHVAKTPPTGLEFLGARPHDELVGWYQRASLLVVPSLWDNSPNVIYEAMACGTPVIASRVGGIPELVDDGITGLLVPPGDPQALAESIIRLLDDVKTRVLMGQCAREKAVAEYSVDKIVAHTLDFYQRSLQNSGVSTL